MIKFLKRLFSGNAPGFVDQGFIDPSWEKIVINDAEKAEKIITEALHMINPGLRVGVLKQVAEQEFPEFRIYRRRYGNKKGGEAKEV